jgi:DnaJ like chaperone protein
MAKYGKWIGAGLGWVLAGGPIGALIGLGVGWMFDSASQNDIEKGYAHKTTPGDFMVSLLVLIAAVMKADGKVVRSELDYVKAFLIHRFGKESSGEALKMLRDLLKQNIPIKDVCLQIKKHLDYSSRLELIHLLYGVANADKQVSKPEIQLIDQIAYYLGISSSEQTSIKNMFIKDTESSYKILGIDSNASEADVKKAYRQLATKYHPDKVSYLGEDIKKSAEEKFRKINEAYEEIKKERGLK